LLQGHAVTLTFKVVTQMLHMHIVHIATFSHTKFHVSSFNGFYVIKGSTFLADGLTDRQKDELTEGKPIVPSDVITGRGNKREMTQLWFF